MKQINIISSLVGAGLHREALLLKDLFESWGHTVRLMHYTDGPNAPHEKADINIFLEVIMPAALALAPINWLAPNPEWWPPINDQYLPHFSKILCKTYDCQRIWSDKVGADKCVYTSFSARDLYDASISKKPTFLHVAGKSGNKGTMEVLKAWQLIPNTLAPITVVASNPEFKAQWNLNHSNITFYEKVDEPTLKRLMNESLFHILPSPYEGYGHAQHEGLLVGAAVIGMNAPPFNDRREGVAGIIEPTHIEVQRLASMAHTSPENVAHTAFRIWQKLHALPMFKINRINQLLRNAKFARQMKELVDA